MREPDVTIDDELQASLAFDDAADYYDETKSLPPDALAATVDLLASEFGASTRLLDIGIGTGMLAMQLVERGLLVDGVDLSVPMLRRVTAKASHKRVGLTVADATQLPFRDDVFDGAFMRHLLHLVPGWRQVLAEAVRVVRPGGKLVVSITDYTGLYREIQARFLMEAGGFPLAVGLRPDDPASLRRAMRSLGAQVRPLPVVRGRRTLTVDEFLAHIEAGRYSWTWQVTDDCRRETTRKLRPWLARRFGDLARPVEPEFAVEWWAFDLPDREAGPRP